MVKAVAFFKRRTGMDGPVTPVDDFRRHWREVHGRGREPAWDGLALVWADDAAALPSPSSRS